MTADCHNCGKNVENDHHHLYHDDDDGLDQEFAFCMECVDELGLSMPDEEVCPQGDNCPVCFSQDDATTDGEMEDDE